MSSDAVAELEERLGKLRRGVSSLRSAIGQRFHGQEQAVEDLLSCLLAGGHALLEGAPGLGKTTLVRSLASALELDYGRVQFTPDLMPADILGTRILESDASGGHRFVFERGPLFAHVVLADEINRATPRTQSALLEAMQEGQVTVHGESLGLEDPFCVIATQNPIEMEGTYPLPEAQLDRFLARVELNPPGEKELLEILERTTGNAPPAIEPCLSREEVLEMRALVREVPVSSKILALVARLVLRTNPDEPDAPPEIKRCVRWGASPRGGQALLLLAKTRALLHDRVHVSLEDIEQVAAPALRHRLVYGYEGEASGVRPDELVAAALAVAMR